MAATATIDTLVHGDDWTVEHTVTDLPVGMTLAAADMYIKPTVYTPDTDPEVRHKQVTLTPSGNGSLVQTGATAVLTFHWTETETGPLTPYASYYFRLRVTDSTGLDTTVLVGQLVPL